MTNFQSWVAEKSKEESNISHLIKLLYGVFSNSVITNSVQFLISVVWIPIALTSNFESTPMKNWFEILWFPGLLYIIVILLNVFALSYKNVGVTKYKMAKESLHLLGSLCASWRTKIDALVKSTISGKCMDDFKREYGRIADYNHRATFICQQLFTLIKEVYGIDDHQVSVMHRGLHDQKKYVTMIAHKNYQNEIPGSFGKRYYVDNLDHIKHFHARQFLENRKGIRILESQSAVAIELVPNPTSDEREHKIQQFIALPVFDSKNELVSLVQIDTCTSGVFGRGKPEIKYNIENHIKPIINMLELWYQKEELAQLLSECR